MHTTASRPAGTRHSVTDAPAAFPVPPAAIDGARIANARGVPGTLGCLAVAHDGRPVLLSSFHVLFGAGAGEGEPVWRMDGDPPAFRAIGRALYGRLGTVDFGRGATHVDCAVALLGDGALPPGWRVVPDPADDAPPLRPGDRVTKTGAATGTTEGVVADVACPAVSLVEGRTRAAPGQLLVRPVEGGAPFSAEGDSGAVLRDAAGRPVGLLWGTDHGGGSLACPLDAVLRVLGIRPARVRPPPGIPRADAPPG